MPTSVIEGFEPSPAEASARDAPDAAVRAADDNGGIKGKRPSKKDKLRAAAQAQTGKPG